MKMSSSTNTSTNFYINSLAGFNDNFYMGASIGIVEELIFIAIFLPRNLLHLEKQG